jgi:hypothetical protein
MAGEGAAYVVAICLNPENSQAGRHLELVDPLPTKHRSTNGKPGRLQLMFIVDSRATVFASFDHLSVDRNS